MESELVTSSDSNNGGENESPPLRYADVFKQACPFYLSIGMTWEQYWDGDNTMVKYYREAEKIRVENRNTEMWIQGAYIYKVLEAFAPILPAFPKKGARVGEYLPRPISLTEEDAKKKEEQESKINYEKNMTAMNAWMKRVNTKRKQGGETNGN